MLKMLLCLMIVVCSTLIGFTYSQKLHKRKAVLEKFVLELKNCHTQLQYTSAQLPILFKNNFMNYTFCDDKPFSDQWNNMLDNFRHILNANDIEVLMSFATNLGTTDTDGELKNIELHTQMLKNNIVDASSDIERKSKLYKTFGLSLGVTIVIFII